MGLGFLRKDSQKGKYSLGPAVLSLGYPLLSQLTFRCVAAPKCWNWRGIRQALQYGANANACSQKRIFQVVRRCHAIDRS